MKLPGRPTLYRLQGPFEISIFNLSTYRTYCRSIDHLVEYFGKDKEPEYITRDHVKHYKAWLAEHKNYSTSTIRKHINAASAFFIWMIMNDIQGVLLNPFLPQFPLNWRRIIFNDVVPR